MFKFFKTFLPTQKIENQRKISSNFRDKPVTPTVKGVQPNVYLNKEDRHVYAKGYHVILIHDQVAKKYKKHIYDFWVYGPKDPETVEQLKNNLELFMKNLTTTAIRGAFGRQPVIHFFNEDLGLNVMVKGTTMEYISGWTLGKKQINATIYKDGNLVYEEGKNSSVLLYYKGENPSHAEGNLSHYYGNNLSDYKEENLSNNEL